VFFPLSLQAVISDEAISFLQRHSHESGNPVSLLKFLFEYLPSNGHSDPAVEFTPPCHSEPQAKNLLTLTQKNAIRKVCSFARGPTRREGSCDPPV